MRFLRVISEYIFGKRPKINSRLPIDMVDPIYMEQYFKIKSETKIQSIDANKEIRIKNWPDKKTDILSKYQIPIADDAKSIAKKLYGKSDSLSVFFLTDERMVRQRYIDGGMDAIEEYAKNLSNQAFVGAPITATLLRRLEQLDKAEEEGSIIDTDIDIDGFTPNSKIRYTLKDVNIDGQLIPARRKLSPRCEMTATLTEGFRVGPFVAYDELYYCTKNDMEQMITDDMRYMDKDSMNRDSTYRDSMKKDSTMKGMSNSMSNSNDINKDQSETVCPHGTDKKSYCNQCHGDIVVKSNKKVIGIFLDITGSMEGRKLNTAKCAVERVLQRIPIVDDISVVLTIFSSDLYNKHTDIIPYGTKFTESIRQSAMAKIWLSEANGNTPLYETINNFMDTIWDSGALDNNKIFFPYTYLIIVSDGEDNNSHLNIRYKNEIDEKGFHAKLRAYRDAGLITEIIPFAYGNVDSNDIQLVKDLQSLSGKILINQADPDTIIDKLIGSVDSILYGEKDLKMMGIPVSRKYMYSEKSSISSNTMNM